MAPDTQRTVIQHLRARNSHAWARLTGAVLRDGAVLEADMVEECGGCERERDGGVAVRQRSKQEW